MFRNIYETLEREISGRYARDLAARIWRFDRCMSFDQFGRCATYCCERMEEIGLEDAEVLSFPADGRQQYGDYRMPRSWDVTDAYLRVVAPKNRAGYLASYREEPMSLAMGSCPTPPEGVTAEVVCVEDGRHDRHYRGVDVRGKIVLTSASTGIAEAAHRHGAVGVITDGVPGVPPARETAMDLKDGRIWNRVAPESECFGFVLSPKQGRVLRDLIASGRPVTVHAKVVSRYYDGHLHAVTGVLPGERRDQEILVMAHLFEPGANDNASGCGLSLEIARALIARIGEGTIPRPRRTIRVLLTYEFLSAMAYAYTHRPVFDRTLAGVNLDMVGNDQARCRSGLIYQRTPDAAPTWLNTLMEEVFEFTKGRFVMPQGEGKDAFLHAYPAGYWGNDCIISDPTVGVPTVGLTQWPDRFYHSSEDSVDKIDPESMRKVGAAAGTMIYFAANAGCEEAYYLARCIQTRAERAMSDTARRMAADACRAADGDAPEAERRRVFRRALDRIGRKLEYLDVREGRALRELMALADRDADGLKAYLDEVCGEMTHARGGYVDRAARDLRAYAERSGLGRIRAPGRKRLNRYEREAAGIVPVRKIAGPPTFRTLSDEHRKEVDRLRRKPIPKNLLFWMDGARDLLEVCRLAGMEQDRDADVGHVLRYCAFLERAGYVTLERRDAE